MAVDASAQVSLEAARATLRGGLSRLRAWVRLLLGVRLATIGVAVGAAAMAVLRGYERLLGVTHPLESAIYPLLAVCAVAALAAILWPLPDGAMAASADRRLGLWDRLATAVELSREASPSGMAAAQVHDAVAHLGALSPRRAYPLRADRMTKVMAACVAALLVVQFAPIPALLLSERERQDRAELRVAAAELMPAVEQLRDRADEADDAEADESARRLERLTERMERGRATRREALLELSELQEALEQLDSEIERPSLRTAREAAAEIGRRGREEMASRAEELAEEARGRGDAERAERMRELAEEASEVTEASRMRELGAELDRAAAQMETTRAPTVLLDALSVALEQEDWAAALDALDALDALQEPLSGGDLELSPEQAAEPADRLEELAEALSETELSELAECLSEAAESARSGDCESAATALGDGTQAGRSGLGAARLGEGVAEMRDAAGHAAQALRQGGSQSSRDGIGPGGVSHQNVPSDAPGTSLHAPRHTPVEARPEQVRSRVGPGGEAHARPMRGAPERVDASRVPFHEAIGEYSRMAEDALQGETVPPAYRGTVRECFDSLQGTTGAATEER